MMRFMYFCPLHPRVSFLLTSAIAAAVMGSSVFWLTQSGVDSDTTHHAGVVSFPRAAESFEPSPGSDVDASADFIEETDVGDRVLSEEVPALIPEGAISDAAPRIITIDRCNDVVAHANVRGGPSQQSDRLGIIARGDRIQLIGRHQGAYHMVRAWYWVDDLASAQTDQHLGKGWIHQCWLSS